MLLSSCVPLFYLSPLKLGMFRWSLSYGGKLVVKIMKPLDSESIRKALTSARDGGFRSIKLRAGDSVFQATLSEEALSWGDTWSEGEEISAGPTVEAVCSPVVGYVKWLPDIVKVGTEVKNGQTIGEVLALGISNEIVVNCTGKIVKVNVEDGAPVEFGKNLLEVEV